MRWVPVTVLLPGDWETVHAKLATEKVLDLTYRKGEWFDPRYYEDTSTPMVVLFLNVTHWCPMEGE